jgi:lipid-A-disaccharide synthase
MAAEPLRIALVAGEVSGDQLGAALMQAIRERCPDVSFEGVPGTRMREAGCAVLAPAEALSVMGLGEVLGHLPRLLALRRRLRAHWLARPPDLFVGIDAPDFNLALERSLKRAGIRTGHCVSPSVWAWRRYRVNRIRHSTDLLLTLFPFEEAFYRERGVEAHCVGHPLADTIEPGLPPGPARETLGLDAGAPCVALLPGSRAGEIRRLLPIFLGAALLCRRARPQLHFLLPVATPSLQAQCRRLLDRPRYRGLPLTLLDGQARAAMQAADAVLLASGTAALECMLVGRPMVVAYRLHPLSYPVIRRMLRVPWVSLPNNLLGRAQVPELLQGEATPRRLSEELLALLEDRRRAQRQIEPFAGVHRELRRGAAQRAAELILQRSGG